MTPNDELARMVPTQQPDGARAADTKTGTYDDQTQSAMSKAPRGDTRKSSVQPFKSMR